MFVKHSRSSNIVLKTLTSKTLISFSLEINLNQQYFYDLCLQLNN